MDDLPLNVRGDTALDRKASGDELATAVDRAVGALYEVARSDPDFKLMAAVERELISRALSETDGNQVQAAKLLGITRATLRKRIEKFGIQRKLEIR